MDRRSFLNKIGLGSIVIGTGGIFKIGEKVINKGTVNEEKEPTLIKLSNDQLMEIAGQILDAIDGKATNPFIQEAVAANLRQYE